MSFGNTFTPRKSDITKAAQYQLPTRIDEKSHQWTFYFTPELEKRFRDYYPRYTNRQMMQMFGISYSVVERLRRRLGVEKNMDIIHRKVTEMARRTCEKNGWYDSMRGKSPSKACLDGYQKKLATGWSSLKALKEKNPRKYARHCKNMSEKRLKLEADERRRMELGLKRKTRLHRPEDKFTKKQINLRYRMKEVYGYILGDIRERYGERRTIYYDDDTQRTERMEQHAIQEGFRVLPLPKEEKTFNYHFV